MLILGLGAIDPAAEAQTTIRKGSEFQVNTRTADAQSAPAVGIDADGDFVIAWLGVDGSENGVFARRFTSAGAAQGAEFQVNTYTPGYQENLSLALDGDGDFVVVWASSGQDGQGNGVFARRFASSGAPAGAEFQVNSHTPGGQSNPRAAVRGDGSFVVAWSSPDGGSDGVFARRFSSAGAAVATEVQINTFTAGFQGTVAIAAQGNGDVVLAWESQGQDDPSSSGVFARRYSSSGTLLAGELQVNSYTTGPQSVPEVAADGSGAFVVVWASHAQDGSYAGVFGRRFDAAGMPGPSSRSTNSSR